MRGRSPADLRFYKALQVTVTWIFIAVPLFLFWGLLGGAPAEPAASRDGRVPHDPVRCLAVLSGVAIAVLWFTLLNSDLGAVNQLLRSIGDLGPAELVPGPEMGAAGGGDHGALGGRHQSAIISWLGSRTSRRSSMRRRHRRRRSVREFSQHHAAVAIADLFFAIVN